MDKTVIFGGSTTLTCRAEGIPKPQISWRNNLGIPADTDPRATALPSGDLLIRNIQLKDAGRYVCVAENSLGKDTAQATLILTGLSKYWYCKQSLEYSYKGYCMFIVFRLSIVSLILSPLSARQSEL